MHIQVLGSTTPLTLSTSQGVIATSDSYYRETTDFMLASSITDITKKNAINGLVGKLKLNGLWDKMYAIYPFVGGNLEINHKFNLINPNNTDSAYRLSFFGSWTFNEFGISSTTLSTNNYVNTFFNPFSSSSVSQNSIHVSVYLASGLDNATCILGVTSIASPGAATPSLQLIRSGNMGATMNGQNSGNFMNIGGPTVSGYMIGNRTSSNVANTWLNGVKSGTSIAASLTPPNYNFLLGVRNQANTRTIPSNKQMRFISIGKGLTDTESANLSQYVKEYQQDLSRAVI